MSKVTVIIPVYNGMPYIRKCLDSIVHQTLKDMDVIVVNDGSNDGSEEVLKEYAQKYENVRVISQENQGLYRARRNGLAEAEGEYIGWIDADDFAEETMFEQLYQAAVENDSELVYCDYKFYPQKIATKEKWYRPYTGKRDVDFIERNSQPWNKLVKHSLLNELNIGDMFPECFDEAYIKILIHAKNPVSLPEELYNYRVGSNSMSSSYKNISHYEKFIDASIHLKEEMKDESEYWQKYFDYRIIYYTLMTMLVAAHAGDRRKYNALREDLFSHPDYKSNPHLNHILLKNYGKAGRFAIEKLIPLGYGEAHVLSNIVLRKS